MNHRIHPTLERNPSVRPALLRLLTAALVTLSLLLGPGCVTVDPWEVESSRYDQVRDGSLDLRGMTRHQVEQAIGYPRYRATLSSAKGSGEKWSYVYPQDKTRIDVTFRAGRVSEVEIEPGG